MRELLDRLGVPGVLATGLVLFCLSFYAGAVAPAAETLAALGKDIERLQAQRAAGPRKDAGTVTARPLPAAGDAADLVTRLGEIGERTGFPMERASFRQIDEGKVRRVEMSLLLKGGYPALRRFLHEAIEASPVATIDALSIRRATRADPAIEAQLTLSYFFSAP